PEGGRAVGELRGAERAGEEAVAATDAGILVVQDDACFRLVEAIGRADGHARRVRAVHAGDRDRFLARHSVVDGHDAPAVNPPRQFVFVLAGSDPAVALDAAFSVAQEFHACHYFLLARLSL